MDTQQTQIKEEWRPVVGFEGRYQVSNLGRVKSINIANTRKSGILKSEKSRDGYYQVTLTINGNRLHTGVHRLVAMAFIPNPDNLPQVNHIDEDKTNNCADNLEWCTQHYNICYGTTILRKSKKIQKVVVQKDLNGNVLNTFDSIRSAMIATGINECSISRVCNGFVNSAGGFLWDFKNAELYKKAEEKRCARNDITHKNIERGKKKEKTIISQYDKNGVLVAKYSSYMEAAMHLGTNIRNIRKVCKGTFSTLYGFTFKIE
jgi:hypothetical protein